MKTKFIIKNQIAAFEKALSEEEKSAATIRKYLREVKELSVFLEGRELSKGLLIEYRDMHREKYKAQTVNGKISAINAYLEFVGLQEMKMKLLKVQRKAFIDESRELSQAEYKRLLSAAQKSKNERLYHLMLTICGTGIRVSELRYITVEAVQRGSSEIAMKGKMRTILIPKELRKRLLSYSKKNKIKSGYIFKTKNGRALDRSNICHDMKRLCNIARVDARKVFPHNLRHLFARSFYAIEKNLSHLADLLGHSSVETTRLYVAVSASEQQRILKKMQLII